MKSKALSNCKSSGWLGILSPKRTNSQIHTTPQPPILLSRHLLCQAAHQVQAPQDYRWRALQPCIYCALRLGDFLVTGKLWPLISFGSENQAWCLSEHVFQFEAPNFNGTVQSCAMKRNWMAYVMLVTKFNCFRSGLSVSHLPLPRKVSRGSHQSAPGPAVALLHSSLLLCSQKPKKEIMSHENFPSHENFFPLSLLKGTTTWCNTWHKLWTVQQTA